MHNQGNPHTARIAFVGQSLGEDEVAAGYPFAGRAGEKFNELLSSAGINRYGGDVYITNLFDFHPKNNDVTPYIKLSAKKKENIMESILYKACKERLRKELEECSANVIVPLGNEALYALTDRRGITDWRGSIIDSTLVPGKKCIPTFHPSFIMREEKISKPSSAYLTRLDLIRALEDSDFPELRHPEYVSYIEPTVGHVCQFLDECMSLPRVGFDIESIYTKTPPACEPTHIGIAKDERVGMCIPLVKDDGQEPYFKPHEEVLIFRKLARILQSKDIIKVGQNLLYDCYWMLVKYGIDIVNTIDTYIAQAICWQELPRGLDTLCSMFTRQPFYKRDGKQYIRLGTEAERFKMYNVIDCCTVFPIIDQQLEILRDQNMLFYLDHKMQLCRALLAMEIKGIRANKRLLKKLSYDAFAEMRDIQAKVDEIVGEHLNLRSSLQLCKYFYDKKKIKPYKSKGGGRTCDSDAMIRLETTHGLKEARLINEFRSLSTRNSTFYQIKLDPDQRLRCSFDAVGAGSRLSSRRTSIGTGMNQQNLPPEVKAALTADPGYVMINMDLSQAENRCVAYIWNVVAMIEAFETGKDLHKLTASAIFGKPPEQISDVKGSTTIGGGRYSERDIGKKGNHSGNYGIRYRKFAVDNEISESEAKLILGRFHGMYPEIESNHRKIQAELGNTRVVTNLYGRKRILLQSWGEDLFKEAYAYCPQTTVGDHMNIHGVNFFYQEGGSEVILLNQVHDSIVWEYPIKNGFIHELAKNILMLKSSLESQIQYSEGRSFYIPVDMQIGFNAGKVSEANPGGMAEYKSRNYDTLDKLMPILEELYQDYKHGIQYEYPV